jgi:hypothetical protein
MMCSTPGHEHVTASFVVYDKDNDGLAIVTCLQCMSVGLALGHEIRRLHATSSG